ncbi:MAG: hypothetical protein MRY83_24240, partial [Flavobacteriales bacterium]|nr:hypothetical protein [Flavobacteriales bacterium]
MQLTLFDREPLDLKDYTIIIIPKGKAFEHISSFKQEYLEKFKAAQYISSPAHITLSTFPLKEDRELFLLYYLERLLTESQRFTINIQDFNCFKNSGLLFLNVSQPEIMSLQKEIVKVLRV